MPDTRHHPFIKAFCDSYKAHTCQSYMFSGKDARAVQSLLKSLPDEPVDELMKAVEWAWTCHDWFLRKSAASLPMLVSQWNQIRAAMAEQQNSGGF